MRVMPTPAALTTEQIFAMWDVASIQITKCSAMREAYRNLYESLAKARAVTDVARIPSFGFTRGAIVRRNGGPNMLVVRGLDDRTVVVVCESDEGGSLRLRDYPTAELEQVIV